MSAFAAKRSLVSIKAALRLLTLLDYFDLKKLRTITDGTVLVTTLLQTTGAVEGKLGFVNITDFGGGRFGFASAAPGSQFESFYTKSVRQVPYSISVLEINAAIVYPGLLDAPTRSDTNLTDILEKAGCKTFSNLISTSGVLKIYESAMANALTVFAPNDDAFKAAGVPDLHKLNNADVATLLEYHAVPDYLPKASLMMSKSPIKTLASGNSGRYVLTATTRGDDVTLNAGMDTSRVASTVVDDAPFCLLTVDSLLLPLELFGNGSALPPSPISSSLPPTVSPPVTTPSPETAKAPSPLPSSPPAPPAESPYEAPADAPDGGAADSTEDSSRVSRNAFVSVFLVLLSFSSFSLLS